MRPAVAAVLLVLVLALGGCFIAEKPTPDDRYDPEPGKGPAASAAELDFSGLSEVQYTYESGMTSPDITLKVEMTDITPNGATLHVEKRTKWMGEFSSATYQMSADDVAGFWDIICEFDAVAWSNLPRRSSYSGNSHNTLRFVVDGTSYYLFDMIDYPDTMPPVKDRFYAKLYNFFNAFVSADPAMEAAWSDDLVDPADMPRNQERTAIFRGREVTLKAGTGSDNGDNALILELSGTRWWIDEGLVGRWVQTEEDVQMNGNVFEPYGSAELWINEDGSWTLLLDGVEHSGTMNRNRYYNTSAGGFMTEPISRGVAFSYIIYEDGQVWHFSPQDDRTSDHLSMECEGLPYPEDPYSFWLYLTRE